MKYLLDTDHISFLQRKSGQEFTRLAARIGQHSPNDFALSIISFHEQVLGAHTLINRAKNKNDTLRGYTLLSEILKGFREAPVLDFSRSAIAIFEQLRQKK
ncbi:MAG: type II toxin-antitoxin system VapC family toxin, partial [Merismopedia sp. SIO2A8]|nr:type II toxin-antitoxin system VapC family toxin [Merismopedia sp. SIO2A8]